MKEIRGLAVLFALALLASACAVKAPGVAVKALAADLVFGIPAVFDPVAPAGTLGDFPRLPVDINHGDPPEVDPPEPCEGPASFPEAAPTVIDNLPAEGTYEFLVTGHQQVAVVGKVDMTRTITKTVEHVDLGDDRKIFIVSAPEVEFGSNRIIEETFEVTQDSVLLISRHIVGGGTFLPTPSIDYLSLPAISGAEWSSLGVDPISLESEKLDANILGRHRLRACDQWVDSWRVATDREFLGADGQLLTQRYQYSVTTGLGGLFVSEKLQSPSDEPTLVLNIDLVELPD